MSAEGGGEAVAGQDEEVHRPWWRSQVQGLLRNGRFRTVSPQQYAALREVHLSNLELTSLPPEVRYMTGVTKLDLHANKLKSLHAEVGQWSSIQALDLSYNQLQSLPAEVGQWSSIQKLVLSSNQLRYLPAEVGQWSSIRTLDLYRNPIRQSSLLRMSARDIVPFFRVLAERCVRVFQQRVVLLGEKEKGKTSLVRRLKTGKPVAPGSIRPAERTFGIEISHWKQVDALAVVADGNRFPVDIEFWDFGGQEAFFPTHQLFLNCDAVFFIVFSWTDDLSRIVVEIRQFCRMIRGYGPADSRRRPVLFIGTHKDKFVGRERELMAKWKRLMEALREDEELSTFLSDDGGQQLLSVSNSDDDVERSGIPRFVEGLRLILTKQGNLGQVLYPGAYIEVEKLVDEYRSGECLPSMDESRTTSFSGFEPFPGVSYDRPPFVSAEEFETQFCTSTNLVRKEDVGATLRFLDLRGSVLFRPVENLVFLDPQWITREVISRTYKLRSDSGVFERVDIEDAWIDLPDPCRERVLQILCSFELAFPVGVDQAKWMVPLALPDWKDERDGPFGPEGADSDLRRFFVRVPHVPDGFCALLMHRWFKIYPDPASTVLRANKFAVSVPPHTPEDQCWAELNVENGLSIVLNVARGAEWLAAALIEKLETLVRLRYSGLRVQVGAKRGESVSWVDRENVQPRSRVPLGMMRFADACEVFPFPNPSNDVRDRFPLVPGFEKHVFISHAGEGHPSFAWLMYRELHRLGLFVGLDVERYVGGASALVNRELDSAISSSLSGLVVVSPSYDPKSEEFGLLSQRSDERKEKPGSDRPSWLGYYVVVLGDCESASADLLRRSKGSVQKIGNRTIEEFASSSALSFAEWLVSARERREVIRGAGLGASPLRDSAAAQSSGTGARDRYIGLKRLLFHMPSEALGDLKLLFGAHEISTGPTLVEWLEQHRHISPTWVWKVVHAVRDCESSPWRSCGWYKELLAYHDEVCGGVEEDITDPAPKQYVFMHLRRCLIQAPVPGNALVGIWNALDLQGETPRTAQAALDELVERGFFRPGRVSRLAQVLQNDEFLRTYKNCSWYGRIVVAASKDEHAT